MLETLGDSLGWTAGAVWRPNGARLACTTAWHAGGARAAVASLANAMREQTFAAGQGLAGEVWAFRRPIWHGATGEALRAGLVTTAAFPIAVGDECFGVIELYATDVREPNAEVSAMFATIGGQLAAYLARRRKRARARRAFDGAGALVVALDADGRVEIANGTACAALGLAEDEPAGARLVRHHRLRPRGLGALPGGRDRRAAVHARRELALVAVPRRRRRAAGRGRLGRARPAPLRCGCRQRPSVLSGRFAAHCGTSSCLAFAGGPARTGGTRGAAGGRQARRGARKALRFFDSAR